MDSPKRRGKTSFSERREQKATQTSTEYLDPSSIESRRFAFRCVDCNTKFWHGEGVLVHRNPETDPPFETCAVASKITPSALAEFGGQDPPSCVACVDVAIALYRESVTPVLHTLEHTWTKIGTCSVCETRHAQVHKNVSILKNPPRRRIHDLCRRCADVSITAGTTVECLSCLRLYPQSKMFTLQSFDKVVCPDCVVQAIIFARSPLARLEFDNPLEEIGTRVKKQKHRR